MIVTGGTLKGRIISAPKGLKIRPTHGKIREAVFQILGTSILGKEVLDLFAGAGAFGIEALSRGANSCVFVDISKISLNTILYNLKTLGLVPKARLKKWDLSKGLPKDLEGPFHLIIMDPPYASNLAEKLLSDPYLLLILGEGGEIIVETRKGHMLPDKTNTFEVFDQRVYGDTQITFIRRR